MPDLTPSILAFCLVFLTLYFAFRKLRLLRETTLCAAFLWGLLGLFFLGGLELLFVMGVFSLKSLHLWQEPLRYAAAIATFNPIMAILGGKRPHDKAWQWIVFTMWVMLVAPSLRWIMFHPNEPFSILPLYKFFSLGMIGLGLLNYGITKYGLPALLVATGQIILLGKQLPWESSFGGPWKTSLGAGCFLLAVLLAQRKKRSPENQTAATNDYPYPSLDRVWLDFRNQFGAFWAIRILQRVNYSANLSNLTTHLEWFGFTRHTPQDAETDSLKIPTLEEEKLLASLQSQLRRFVTEEWIQKRLVSETDLKTDQPETAAKQQL